ncbi:27 kDa antigen Cfp30B [Planctomycetes bacterium Pla163]|uniref:27 kDa antigen Cfp30B n=1 Tax=Rohdeia mirabilis TaxID=2528008 RepID=A0A518CX10_9BACT|nr:27 kDa antigen Cfp30B [Planctomycetes bacterium Pla163]
MSTPFVSRVGGTMSADIAVPEHERVVAFYSRVLTTGEAPLWREDLMNNRGMPVIGLGARVPEYADLPLQWMPHIQVTDVATSAARAVELGGRELMHGKDDDGASQWAVLLDPNGAAFGIIPLVPADALPPAEEGGASEAAASAGHIAWLDLTVTGAQATRDFYREVLGWTVEDAAMEDAAGSYADYAMVAGDGNAVAGVCHARGPNAGLPPVWMLYLPVGDLGESLRRVSEGGGEVIRTTSGKDGEIACAFVRDPVGACLALVPA